MMTHGPPRGILDHALGCENLLRAAGRARPLMYCFGHIHEGYGAEVVTWKDDDIESLMMNEVVRREVENTFPLPDKLVLEFGKETLSTCIFSNA